MTNSNFKKRQADTAKLLSELVEKAIIDFAKEIIDGIDDGRISHSSDLVDFTAEYIERLEKNVKD